MRIFGMFWVSRQNSQKLVCKNHIEGAFNLCILRHTPGPLAPWVVESTPDIIWSHYTNGPPSIVRHLKSSQWNLLTFEVTEYETLRKGPYVDIASGLFRGCLRISTGPHLFLHVQGSLRHQAYRQSSNDPGCIAPSGWESTPWGHGKVAYALPGVPRQVVYVCLVFRNCSSKSSLPPAFLTLFTQGQEMWCITPGNLLKKQKSAMSTSRHGWTDRSGWSCKGLKRRWSLGEALDTWRSLGLYICWGNYGLHVRPYHFTCRFKWYLLKQKHCYHMLPFDISNQMKNRR